MALRTTNDIQAHMKKVLDLGDNRSPSPICDSFSDISGGGENAENSVDVDTSENSDAETNDYDNVDGAIDHPIYNRGKDIYDDSIFKVHVVAVAARKRTRYSLSDHLFDVQIIPKDSTSPPRVLDLEDAIEKALVIILDNLKKVYDSKRNQNQVYITIVEKGILRGLNSGNYSLHTPSNKISRWVMALLYNYLKSKQTLLLNSSFKIQIKVLSRRHTNDLVQNKKKFRQHIYH